MRHDGRQPDQLRPVKIKRRFTRSAPGSVLIQAGRTTLLCAASVDRDYQEHVAASVDMNVVMTGRGQFVEVQGTGEEATFSEKQLTAMLRLARGGIRELTEIQQRALGRRWPFG